MYMLSFLKSCTVAVFIFQNYRWVFLQNRQTSSAWTYKQSRYRVILSLFFSIVSIFNLRGTISLFTKCNRHGYDAYFCFTFQMILVVLHVISEHIGNQWFNLNVKQFELWTPWAAQTCHAAGMTNPPKSTVCFVNAVFWNSSSQCSLFSLLEQKLAQRL